VDGVAVVAAPRVVAIVGPTASGKSALALAVARDRRGEIVSCDSLQVYRGLDVGSAKATADERAMVPHHLLDVVEPDQDFSAADYGRLARAALEPYEVHVLKLVDGERSILDICKESEIGDNETMKVLYALVSTGEVRVKGKKVVALDQDFVPVDTIYSVLDSFNQMYEHIFKYMVREVGPIAENVLEKYLGTLRDGRKDVFGGVKLQKDGTLDVTVIERNLNKFPEEQRRGLLVDGLNELLYAELLAIKRTLGAEHEAAIVKALKH